MTKMRQLRKKSGLSVKELAIAARVTTMSIYRYERGIRVPTVDVAAKICVALGCSVDELLGRTPGPAQTGGGN